MFEIPLIRLKNFRQSAYLEAAGIARFTPRHDGLGRTDNIHDLLFSVGDYLRCFILFAHVGLLYPHLFCVFI